jgi:hypothetical protein
MKISASAAVSKGSERSSAKSSLPAEVRPKRTMMMTTTRLVSAVIMSSVLISLHRVNIFYGRYLNEIEEQPVIVVNNVFGILPSPSPPPSRPPSRPPSVTQSSSQSLRANRVEVATEKAATPTNEQAISNPEQPIEIVNHRDRVATETEDNPDPAETEIMNNPAATKTGAASDPTETKIVNNPAATKTGTTSDPTETKIVNNPVASKTETTSDPAETEIDSNSSAESDDYYDDDYFNEDFDIIDDRRRAIVLISTGAKAANISLVERFIWSARNIGNYTGWIVLITDADQDRYANLKVAEIPNTGPKIKNWVTTSRDDSNLRNHFLVFRTQEPRFKRITKFKPFKSSTTMSSKIYKTYILQYAMRDRRLDDVELFYYLDIDIVFGNSVRPLFSRLEKQYNIGRPNQKPKGSAETLPGNPNNAKIYFFEGNGRQQIQGGQIVVDRKQSQPCLDRWRELMQKLRNTKFLKDQIPLTMMLDEQRTRPCVQKFSNITSKKKDCDIVLMKQDKELIQFPELDDIRKRKPGQEHPTLIHFRNSANVMKNVEDREFQKFLRDVFQFKEDQEDELGILDKMLMDVDKKKKSF